jgi:RNA polymerase sigma-70 factor (ECF subfamily)
MTWLLTIARRVVVDELRRDHRRTRLRGRLADEAVSDVGETSDQAVWQSYLGVLDPDRRLAFVLTQVLGYSDAEAAVVAVLPCGHDTFPGVEGPDVAAGESGRP